MSAAKWLLARASSTRGNATLRLRTDISPAVQRRLSHAVSLVWRFQTPAPAVQEQMERFEDCLSGLVDDEEESLLVAVLGVDDSREWLFYARDTDAFVARLNEALRGAPPFPIGISSTHDEHWGQFRELAETASARRAR